MILHVSNPNSAKVCHKGKLDTTTRLTTLYALIHAGIKLVSSQYIYVSRETKPIHQMRRKCRSILNKAK